MHPILRNDFNRVLHQLSQVIAEAPKNVKSDKAWTDKVLPDLRLYYIAAAEAIRQNRPYQVNANIVKMIRLLNQYKKKGSSNFVLRIKYNSPCSRLIENAERYYLMKKKGK